MSNAKWRKCLQLLNQIDPDIQVIWKFVGSENNGVRHALPTNDVLEEKYLSSRFWFGPAYYKEVEWLEFPTVGKPYGKENIPAAFFDQNVAAIVEALKEIGKWQIAKSDLGFRLYGHQ
jgi:hypothetical protein